jgi:hypothetical protein
MGRRFVVLTCSKYPFYKKTNGKWDKLLKSHYKFLQTFLLWNMDESTASFQDCHKIVNNMR